MNIPRTLTKAEQVREQLKAELASLSRLGEGDRFLSLSEVCAQYSISLATAHKVVHGLVKQGYLKAQRGKGYFVARKPSDSDVHALFKTVSASASTRKILLVNDFDGEVGLPATVLAGVQDACRASRYVCEISPISSEQLVEAVEQPDVAGIVLVEDRRGTPLRLIKKPKIVVGHWSDPADGVISFVADAERAGIETVRHLCGLGHHRIAFLAGACEETLTESFMGQAVAGMRRGFQSYGLNWADAYVRASLKVDHRQMIESFVSSFRDHKITAAFVPAWSTLAVLIQELRMHDLDVPKDLSLVAYGWSPTLAEVLQPPMTTFDLFVRDIARKATEVIIEFDRDAKPLPRNRFVTFPIELTPGKSTRSLY
jgi:DNA-binding LacI/PurR family transcriptional regulator